MTVYCTAAARPNFMKVAPILRALESSGQRAALVHTGQHYDESMSGIFFEELEMRPPDHHLDVGSGSHAFQTGRVMEAFERLLIQEQATSADVVVTVGDVNSTLACSIVAAKSGLRVAHVEAGLRSREWSMPEEINRVVADRVSDLLFAPSSDAVANLEAEGYHHDQIHLVGNVMVDSLFANRERASARDILRTHGLRHGGYALVTLHRPSNVDDEHTLRGLISALESLTDTHRVVMPVHPRTKGRLEAFGIEPGFDLIEPTGYLDSLCLQAGAALVLTDSGGIQEETTALGVPCLTLRESTERPITISEGTNRLVGTDPEVIVRAAVETLAHPPPPRRPALWDGRAAERIATVLATSLCRRPRPTDLR
ncbi:MAG: UDP-N-acetylglucosamine 2-epimerase (non-hydrolyzing) [Actinomycetota bacterium]|nr:UDP-N-acetylglucosamine 2-epimerase (non-hydrolyzing) [Actinomycetota bacterium]